MRQFFRSRAGRLAILIAAVCSVVLTSSLDTFGSWALLAPGAAALVAAVVAVRVGSPLRRAPLYGLASGIATFVLFPIAFIAVGLAVLTVYAAYGLFCVLIDFVGLPSDWCF